MADEVENEITEEEIDGTTGEDFDGEDEMPDLSELSFEELSELEEALLADYAELRGSEEFAAADEAVRTEAEDILSALEFVQTHLAAFVVAAEDDAAVEDMDNRAVKLSDTLATELAAKTPSVEAEAVDATVEASSEDDETSEDVETESAPEAKDAVALGDETEISPAGLKGDKPKDAVESFNYITASADVPGYSAGQQLPDLSALAKAFMAKRPHVRGTDKGNDGYRYLVASLAGEYPDERVLGDDALVNMRKIDAVTSPAAITASGGFCAPLTPYYALQTFGDTGRPVRDSLASYKADRGGIRFVAPPKLSNLSGAVRRTTATQDAAGYTNQTPAGTTAPKPCLHVTCQAESTAVVEAVSRCLTFGNLGARTYPEQVEAWLKLVMVEFSRYAEVELLDMISSASTAVTAAQWGSATASLLEQVTLAVTAFKARNRVMNGVTMKALMPFWAKELIRTDISHQPPFEGADGAFGITDEMIGSWFAARGIQITWYQDNTTAAGVPFAAQGAGALKDWPDTIEWFLYPEGAFLYLDGGSLDLGLVRDSTLNSQNDYQIWAEEFFSVVFLGTEAYKVTSTVCPNGNYGGKVETTLKPGCP